MCRTAWTISWRCLGAQPTQYSRKFLCCGSALGTNIDVQAANEITREKLQHMKKHQIEAVAVACPSCFYQFDRGQMMLERKHHDGFGFPPSLFPSFSGWPLAWTGPISAWKTTASASVRFWKGLSDLLDKRINRIPIIIMSLIILVWKGNHYVNSYRNSANGP